MEGVAVFWIIAFVVGIAYHLSKKTRPCPACGGKVSTRARTCPHCGDPLDE
jgi:hypothetical protein